MEGCQVFAIFETHFAFCCRCVWSCSGNIQASMVALRSLLRYGHPTLLTCARWLSSYYPLSLNSHAYCPCSVMYSHIHFRTKTFSHSTSTLAPTRYLAFYHVHRSTAGGAWCTLSLGGVCSCLELPLAVWGLFVCVWGLFRVILTPHNHKKERPMYDCLLCSDDLAQVGRLELAPACPRLPFVF
jgi:hypothetical protein